MVAVGLKTHGLESQSPDSVAVATPEWTPRSIPTIQQLAISDRGTRAAFGQTPHPKVTPPRGAQNQRVVLRMDIRPGAESVASNNIRAKTPVFADSTRPRNFPGAGFGSLARFMPCGAVVCCTVQPCGGFGPPCRIGWQL